MTAQNTFKGYHMANLGKATSGFKTYEIALIGLENKKNEVVKQVGMMRKMLSFNTTLWLSRMPAA